eukprot:3201314-Rhodomonas_salina.1
MSENLSDTNSGQEEVTERNRPPLATLCPWHGFVFTRPRFQLSHPVNRQSLQARTMHSLAVLLLVVGGVVGNAYVIDSRYELPFPKIGTRLTQLRPSRLCLRGGGNEVEIRIRCKETQPGENVGIFKKPALAFGGTDSSLLQNCAARSSLFRFYAPLYGSKRLLLAPHTQELWDPAMDSATGRLRSS